MVKAIFMDFYGTLVKEVGPTAIAVMQKVYDQGRADSLEAIGAAWFAAYAAKTRNITAENFRTQYDISLEIFQELLPRFKAALDPKSLNDMMVENWSHPPVYEGAKAFLEAQSLPVYLVTNSDDFFARPALAYCGLHPAGMFTSEQARSFKPRPELFRYALEQTRLAADEVIHIGDSLDSDVYAPQQAGIRAIWLNRRQQPVPAGVVSVSGFGELQKKLALECGLD